MMKKIKKFRKDWEDQEVKPKKKVKHSRGRREWSKEDSKKWKGNYNLEEE